LAMSAEKDKLADEIICACSGTTRGQVYDLVQQGKDLEAISRWTGAKTGCGGCDWDLEVFVRALEEEKIAKT
jgi:bacterioferritin-associated ferredoxin